METASAARDRETAALTADLRQQNEALQQELAKAAAAQKAAAEESVKAAEVGRWIVLKRAF